MSKFYILVIYTGLHMERLWVSNDNVKELLLKDEVANIYRSSTDQYAIIVDHDVMWVDIETRDYVSTKTAG